MRKLIFLIIFALVFAQPLMASDQGDVKDLVERNIKIVMGFIKNKSLDKETRNRKIIDSMAPFFDFNFMAKVCLGKKYWKPLSKTKRKEFTELFVKRLKESYIEKFDLYTDEEVEVEAAKKVKKRIHVVTYLVSKGDRMEMIFKFRKTKKGWKVYDLEILGVSIVLTYRSQFSGFLKKNSMDDLLEKLAVTGSFATSGSKK
ncbi:MAG: ABC transporter substrate-binding protein [Deltaproteobacteria bacterium]|jgi:phospholipid transport system substrate-binding protein|nr:ABC transporter substrate-binding protein [Deltaproteobacteria bacterium]MBT4088192.1 ABC transporter substrate-binding protein [Deltaproteobacteria bacterium]MBT4263218.1 ABC transporter substrate-binding protein [Deltaproteobacteria bacterium]MBT4642341.1 ABC transporter substrate-binding protein [Deltaproteobacteria bacterium]MBT6500534.1 ABC transporter substrate-binding protein [Deltaproteobacteria bacterium]